MKFFAEWGNSVNTTDEKATLFVNLNTVYQFKEKTNVLYNIITVYSIYHRML